MQLDASYILITLASVTHFICRIHANFNEILLKNFLLLIVIVASIIKHEFDIILPAECLLKFCVDMKNSNCVMCLFVSLWTFQSKNVSDDDSMSVRKEGESSSKSKILTRIFAPVATR